MEFYWKDTEIGDKNMKAELSFNHVTLKWSYLGYEGLLRNTSKEIPILKSRVFVKIIHVMYICIKNHLKFIILMLLSIFNRCIEAPILD